MLRAHGPVVAMLVAAVLLCSTGWSQAEEPAAEELLPAEEPAPDAASEDDWDSLMEDWDVDDTSGMTGVPPAGPTGPTGPGAAAPPAIAFGMMGIFMVFYMGFIFLMVFGQLAAVVLKLLAIYDAARRDFDDPSNRAIWCVVIAFVPLIGAIIYYFVVYRDNRPPIQMRRPPIPVAPIA